MNRLEQKLAKLKAEGRKAFVAYIVAGDPALETTVPLMNALVEAGVDIIELGVPFSDPEAEGPVIQLAHERALAEGVTLRRVMKMTEEFRDSDDETPIILMGYLNPIEQMGYETFAKDASSAGVDGTIIVNLPPEEFFHVREHYDNHNLSSVFLLAPTTTDKRAELVTAESRGFVYYVSLKGTTGAGSLDIDDVAEKVNRFSAISPVPVLVGFGIKDATSAQAVANVADGVVVGSAIVDLMAKHAASNDKLLAEVTQLVSEIRQGIDATNTQ